ncbi:MAG: hypothetical protein WBG73_04185 [Coleofasciculaceae cyanobacterium]
MRVYDGLVFSGRGFAFEAILKSISDNYWESQEIAKLDSQTISKSRPEIERSNFFKDDYRRTLYECNSWDYDDANKYCGYLAREYNGSRFGSYPLCDDYGEDSHP